MIDSFHKFAAKAAETVGRPWAFTTAVVIIVAWVIAGPFFGYSDSWQLVINTGTTIVTFLMVFLIQNSQNRDAKAIHLKLDELIRSVKGARNLLIDLEEVPEEELRSFQEEFKKFREEGGMKASESLS